MNHCEGSLPCAPHFQQPLRAFIFLLTAEMAKDVCKDPAEEPDFVLAPAFWLGHPGDTTEEDILAGLCEKCTPSEPISGYIFRVENNFLFCTKFSLNMLKT